jgi:hypothetical protein
MAFGLNTDEILNNLNDGNNEELLQNKKDASLLKDIAAAPFRGIEGAVQGAYQLADWATFDYLPDYDNRFLGRSETIAGSLVEGITQFVVPYGAISKGVSAAGKATKFAKPFMKTNKKGKEVLNWKGVLASEAATDFVAFDAQEERLSNLVQAFPSLSNPITEYLAAEEDDGELEGRFKNALEGMGITGVVAGSFGLALKAHKKMKTKPVEAKKIGESMQLNQIRTVPVEDYSPAVKASKSVFTKSKKIKEGGIMAHQMRKEFDAYGEKGTGEELRWMGFDDWLKEKGTNRVTQKEVDTFLEEKQLQYKLVERSGKDTNVTYENFKQKGGDNYREFIFETNDKAVKLASENIDQHFNDYTLMHFRTTDRFDETTGQKVLFVEELQSDIIQKSRGNDFTEGKQIPLEDSYISSSMRMIMQLASKEGYDRVQWGTPQQIADLYDASVENIKLNSVSEDGVRSFDITKNGRTETKVAKNDNEVVAMFGKKAADDIISRLVKEGDETGEYMVKQDSKSFNQYKDKMVSAVNKVAKPFGAKVGIKTADSKNSAAKVPTSYIRARFFRDATGGRTNSNDAVTGFLGDSSQDVNAFNVSFIQGTKTKAVKALANDLEDAFREIFDADELEEIEYLFDSLRNADDTLDIATTIDSLPMAMDGDVFDTAANTIENFLINKKLETPSLRVAPDIDSFGIDINKGMKESVQNVRLWGLKTGDEALESNQIQDPLLREVLNLDAVKGVDPEKITSMERRAGSDGMLLGNATVRFSLERLVEGGTTDQIRKVAKGISELMKGNKEFDNTLVSSLIKDSDNLGSFTFDNKGQQYIDLNTAQGAKGRGAVSTDPVFTERTLLHEIVHSATARFIPPKLSSMNGNVKGKAYMDRLDEYYNDKYTHNPAVKGLITTYKEALENIPEEFKGLVDNLNDPNGFMLKTGAEGSPFRKNIRDWYGFTNLDEFLSEALTNSSFQNFLRSIETREKSYRTLWQKVVDVLSELFNAKGTLLNDVISNFAELVSGPKKKFDYHPNEYMSSPYARLNSLSRGSRRNEVKFFQATGAAKSGVTVENRGGQIAVEGTVKAISEVETAYDLGEVLAKAETSVLEEMERTGSIGFYEDGKLQGSDGLKGGGIVQAVEQARRMAEMSGQKIDIVESEVRAAGKDAAALRRIAARMYTVESIAVQQGSDIVAKAKKIAAQSAEATDADRAELMGDIQKMLNLVAAGSNLRRGFGQGLQSTQFARTKLSLSSAERRSQEIVNQYMASNKGEKNNFDALINRIILAGGDPKNMSAKDMIDQMLGVVKAGRASEGGKFMEMAQNWFINSLLSGPRTMMKNGIGNMITQTLLQTELAVGGLTVDPSITRMVLKEMATFESFRESMKYFLDVYALKDQLLDIGRNPLENTANTGIPKYFDNAAPEETIKQSMNWFSENVVNVPAKTLMAMDEVFKQSVFRQNAKMEWTLKGMKLGIKDPDALSEYVMRGMDAVLVDGERAFSDAGVMKFAQATVKKMDDELVASGKKPMTPQKRGAEVNRIISEETQKRADMLKSYEEGGLGLENISDIDNVAARSLEQARYATFTNDAGAFADLAQAMTQKVPPLRLIFPFIRTPVNILKFSFDRASGGMMDAGRSALARMPDMPMLKRTQEELRMKLNSRDPIEVARTRGKIATAVMINSTLMYMIMTNRDFITGGGPKDIAQRKTLEETGWQKYSLKFGNQYASFAGLDPLGTHFGVLVDIVEQFDEQGSHNTTLAEQMFAAASISLSRNVTEKSYLAGLKFLTDAISEPDRKMERAVRNIAGGFVPNVLYQSQSVMGDTTAREVRSLSDAFMKKLPFGNDNLDPKRNILGEPIIMEQFKFVGPFNPSAMSTRDGDVVFEELAALDHGFTQTSTMLDRSIDMTEFVNDKGQTAYDRRLELLSNTKIRGKTLRQELEKLINSSRYQRLSPLTDGALKSPRVALINRVLSKYRSRSLSLMMEEFPEIETEYKRMRSINKQAKRGASTEALQALLDA